MQGFIGHVKDFGPYFQNKGGNRDAFKNEKALKEKAQSSCKKPRLSAITVTKARDDGSFL